MILTIASTLVVQPSDLVVSTNQSRAMRSDSERESLDIPVSVSPLFRGQIRAHACGAFGGSKTKQL